MKHSFRSRIAAGELLVGTMVTLNSPEVSELLAKVGFDWLFIDAEHSPLGPPEVQRIMQGAGRQMPCLVRLPSAGEVPIKKALDSGAAGIIAPQINSAKAAEDVVRMAKYAPGGSRGVGVSRAHGYGLHFQEYLSTANEELTVVAQAEHVEAVRNIESIVATPGIDAVFVGPYDLSASLGKPGQVDDPEVQAAIDRVTQVCIRAGMRLGVFGMRAAAVKPFIESGYTLIVAGIDTVMLGRAAADLLTKLK
ncbi:MAG: 2,4-dihydroxyhept-2-ene-1,7-dioic acid aldolase [Chloroflexota bacterium]|nr:MAG: 2,4-dihydroxyhept-2-ene-1,7-dioic acid aldolase [Chloroflexota bacterium]